METLFENKNITSPKASIILLDWSCRESFHCLDYLNKQTVPRQTYEILWIEYYRRKPAEIDAKLKKSSKTAVIDQWIVLGMPEDSYYHKHLMYNVGIAKSRGDITIICDSDGIYQPSFVETIIKTFQDDPDIVLHLDQVRNTNKKFYPFSYPSVKKLLGKGCVNFKDGKTTGLWDEADPLHSRNYGACMAAKRSDLIAIGGADEHIDFLGHVCGPYDMTFRLKNLGKKEIWHDKEFIYHAWHPGQSGDKNYVGPHDGRLVSTTALEVLRSGRIQPLVENEVIKILRERGILADRELEEKLVDTSYAGLFDRDEISRKGKVQLWYDHELIRFYKDYNIIRYKDKLYGIPAFLKLYNLGKELEEENHPTIVTDETTRAVMKQIDRIGQSSLSPKILAQYKDWNIVQYGRRVYGVPQNIPGGINFHDAEERSKIKGVSADTLEAVKELIDKTDRSLYFPVMLNIYREYSIVKYRGKIYGIPVSMGKVEFTQESNVMSLPGILLTDTQEELVNLIDLIKEKAKGDYQSAQETRRSMCLMDTYRGYNIIAFRRGVYGIPESFGSVDLFRERWLNLPGVLSGYSLEEVKRFIKTADSLLDVSLLLDEYKKYNLVRYNNHYYAVPHSIGKINFCDEEQRSHPEIISADSCDELKMRIDKLDGTVPVEYAGWLPSFRWFGNCGFHPQFAHINKPPEGYRFTYSQSAIQSGQKTLRQRVTFLVRGMFIFVSALNFAFSAWSKGAKWRNIFRFFRTRGIKSQFLLPRKRHLLFLPSVPYTFGQLPWIIEIEDSISLLFPFIHNGQTASDSFYKSPYFPVFKTLFESKRCRGIITHIKSTAESLPKLFKSNKLASKITHVPLGVKIHQRYHAIETEDDKIRILFNNSWHQDSRSFSIRGGFDVLSAFDKVHKKYPHVYLTLRTSLPSLDKRYLDIIERNGVKVIGWFLPEYEWQELMCSSNIYLLPSDRIHVVSILEAMSYGLAVVASDGWGIQEYIQHEKNGMIVKGRYGKVTWIDEETGMLCENYEVMQKEDPHVVEGIVEALSSLIENKQLRHSISRQARKDIEDKYNLENWNRGLKVAFDKALNGSYALEGSKL